MPLPPSFLPRFLRLSLLPFSSSSSSSGSKPQWNSNHNLVVTHPVLSLIESCTSMARLKEIQAHITRTGLIAHLFPASRLLAFCAHSSPAHMPHARRLFAQIPRPNTYIWNTLIRGHSRSQDPTSSLHVFRDMARRVPSAAEMDSRTFVFALKACEQLPDVSSGEMIQSLVCKLGFDAELLVQNGLVHFYLEHGWTESARKVFEGMLERDVVSWTTMIDGYAQGGCQNEALKIFGLMLCGGDVFPNEVTMIAVVSACSQMGVLRVGEAVHGYIKKRNINISVNLLNSLVDMYGKCGSVDSARKVFDSMERRDVFSWTSMLNSYAKCGQLDRARQLFIEMPEKNAVSWSSMIAGYSQTDRPKEALDLFHEMIAAQVEPIDATLVSVLSACARSGRLDLGTWIYERYINRKRIKPNVKLVNALIEMYAKCGSIDTAAKLFHEMPERDVVSWNSIIMAHAVHGFAGEALSLFEQFKCMGLTPDDITFVGVLSACSHGGLVVEGRRHFKDMKLVFGIEPKVEHYACLIDLLGRVGLIQDAYELVRCMPMEPAEAGWGALLNACRMHGNVELGKHAGDKLLIMDPGDSGIYALIANMYAIRHKWDDVKRVRSMMRVNGVKKIPGCSSIEVDGKSHEFLVADKSHFRSKDIYIALNGLYLQLWKEDNVPSSHVEKI